jgi:hypothetical protein
VTQNWEAPLARLRAKQTELSKLMPYRDTCLIPLPGAPEVTITKVEATLGSPLPDSYRSFVKRYNGWPRFFEGASLLGTRDLGKVDDLRLARAIFHAAASPSEGAPPPSYRSAGRRLLVFGTDRQGTTLFAFDLEDPSLFKDPPVIAWVSELGLRYPTFADFLTGLADMCESELANAQELGGKGPASGVDRSSDLLDQADRLFWTASSSGSGHQAFGR